MRLILEAWSRARCLMIRRWRILTAAVMLVSVHTWADAGEWRRFGLQGVSLSAVAVHPGDSQLIFGGEGPEGCDGVWRSSDGGSSWALMNAGISGVHRVNAFAFVPADDEGQQAAAMFIATLNFVGPSLYRSTDRGLSWTPITLGLPNAQTEITAVAVDPSDPRILYAGLNDQRGGVVKSSDGGLSWRDTGPDIYDGFCNAGCVLDVEVHPARPGTVLVSMPALFDVYKSTDTGASWFAVGCGQQPEELLLHPRQPDTVYITGSVPSWGGVSMSTDAGSSWTFLANQPGLPPRDDASHRAIISHPARPELLFLVAEHWVDLSTVEAVYRSSDGGWSWVMDDRGLEGVLVRGFAFRGGRLLAATDDGIYEYSQDLFVDTPEPCVPSALE